MNYLLIESNKLIQLIKIQQIEMQIFITKEQQEEIDKIDKQNILKKDKERELSNETKPWKWKSVAFIDKKLYCHFKNGNPEYLIYNGTNLGNFYLTNHNDNLVERKMPHKTKIQDYISKNNLKDFILVYHSYQSDGCFSGTLVEIYNENIILAKFDDYY